MSLNVDSDSEEEPKVNNPQERNIPQEQQPLQVPDGGLETAEAPVTGDQAAKFPKKDETIRYKQPGSEWKEATVLGRAGKSTGKYSSWINVKTANDETTCIDLENVEWEHTANVANDIQSESEVLYTIVPVSEHQTSAVKDAKKKEIENWENFNVFEKVENKGQKAITTTWVITRSVQADSI